MNAIKRFFLWLQLCGLQATAQGQQDVLAVIPEGEYRDRVMVAHLNTLAAIDQLKAERRRLIRGIGLQAIEV